MSAKTAIEWTDATWNPVVGCSRVSAGCRNCYAYQLHDMRHAAYMVGKALPPQYALPFDVLQFPHERVREPLRWKKPRRIFVNSVSDLFHKDVPDWYLDNCFAVMALAKWHTFQVLTKRADRMRAYFAGNPAAPLAECAEARIFRRAQEIARERGEEVGDHTWPLPNVWLGVSVENQDAADERIPLLLQVPAAVRFLSCEPLLGPVDIAWTFDPGGIVACGGEPECSCAGCAAYREWPRDHNGELSRIDWVIAGGESGRGARLMHPDWARSLRDQCQDAGVAFFFKQWGEWTPGENVTDQYGERGGKYPTKVYMGRGHWSNCSDDWMDEQDHGPILYRVGKKKAGRLLDGVTHDEFPGGHGA